MVIENVKTRKSTMISQAKANQNLTEKAARAEKAAAVWNRNKIFEGKLSNLSEDKRQATGINLTNQARFMKRLTESELSTEFSKMAPVNVMKLVERTYTNVNRGNVFATFQMETANDALYYLKHHFDAPFAYDASKSTKYNWAKRADMLGGESAEVKADPYGFDKALTAKDSANNTYYSDTRKSIYDARQDRFANELQNGVNDEITSDSAAGVLASVSFTNDAFKGGTRIIPGYITVYSGDDPQSGFIAFQDQSTYDFYIDEAYQGKITVEEDPVNHKVIVKAVDTSKTLEDIFGSKDVVINAFARFNSEDDYEGDSMGEVTVMLSTYNFRPHRTSVGASWTHLSAITLGASYQQELDDLLLKGAADVIQAQLDYRAFKEAYQIARTNPGQFTVKFDCAYTGTKKSDDADVVAKDGYVDNAQTLGSAIQILSSAIYEVRQQGAINNMVAGLSAVAYIRLNAGFSTKGAQKPCGVFKVGELDGTPVYQAPQAVIPTKEILCIYKNDEVENDAAIVIATLIPFVSNKLDYPTFYTRAGLATYGDRVILNRNYLGRIVLENLKDAFVDGQVM